jgi:hypothetical protein
LELDLVFTDAEQSLFKAPSWVEAKHLPFYSLGILIRSCILGQVDWTRSHNALDESLFYKGFKTSLIKRQLGMMHSPEALQGEVAPMSHWLTDLLFVLLQYPGIQINGSNLFSSLDDLNHLKNLIEKRIAFQTELFCSASNIPAYVEKINLDWPDDKKDLKVVMVQSMLPFKKDFISEGLMLNTPKYKARHRRHVSAVAELISYKVYGHNSINDDNYKDINIDLIIWPELSVHNDDIDILEQLSQKTGAIIVTGINFVNIPNVKGPNNVVKWIIPTKSKHGRQFITRLQGKQNMTANEKLFKVIPWRPYQLIVELEHPAFKDKPGFRMSSSICYDATDIKMSSDLKDKTDAYIIPALNEDIDTFDNMVDALFYHMYQHVVLVNTGEFGGSVAKAPYKGHEKLISHVHGAHQVAISTFDMNMFDFRDLGFSYESGKSMKTPPAGNGK